MSPRSSQLRIFSGTKQNKKQDSSKKQTNKPKKESSRDVPGGPVVKNPPASAGDTGSIPGPGWSHMLCAVTAEPALKSLQVPTREATSMRSRSPQLEKVLTQHRRPRADKNSNNKNNKYTLKTYKIKNPLSLIQLVLLMLLWLQISWLL